MPRLLAFIGALGIFAAAVPCAHAQGAVIGYYNLSDGANPSTVPWQRITHLNVAFAGIDATGQCNWVHDIFSDAFDTVYKPAEVKTAQSGVAALLQARAANNPNVKISLSVGGAGLSYRFSAATATNLSRWTLAWSCWNLAHTLGLDGLDYDWEYPGRYGQPPCPTSQAACASPSDTANLATLLADTRAFMGTTAPLSVAVHNQQSTADEVVPYDYAGMDAQLSFWNVMVYELSGSWSNGTQLQSPYSAAVDSMTYWANQNGVTKSKLILGAPFYSKYWSSVSTDRGLGTYGGVCNNQGVPYSLVSSRCQGSDPDWQCSVTTVSDGAYCYCANQQIWYTYDGPAQMQQKARYVAAQGLGGMMFWQLPGDSTAFELTESIAAGSGTQANAAAIIAIIL